MDVFSRVPKVVTVGPSLLVSRKRASSVVTAQQGTNAKQHRPAMSAGWRVSNKHTKHACHEDAIDAEDLMDDCVPLVDDANMVRVGILHDPQPMMLLSQDDGCMRLHVDALKIMQGGRRHVPLVLISIVGKARRGKSFLLNRSMLGRAKQMFQVSSSSNACTKGIIIHGRPWPLRLLAAERGLPAEEVDALPDVDVLFADSEGIDATDRTDGYDNNMLTFACVTSSAIIYNAHGPIDEDALSKISTIAEVGRGLLEENGGVATAVGETPHGLFPSFHWCARDFALDCHDASGRDITPDEYLEFQLSDQQDQHPKKTAMRRALRSFFRRRMCHTLPRPVAGEDELRHVQEMEDHELRPQFMDALRSFRSRLLSTLTPRVVDATSGRHLTAVDMVSMMQKFVHAINDGGVPNIQDSWQQVTAARAQRAVAESVKAFESSISTYASPSEDGTHDEFASAGDAFHGACAACGAARAAYGKRTSDLPPAIAAECEAQLAQALALRVRQVLDTWDNAVSRHRQRMCKILQEDVGMVAAGCSLLFDCDDGDVNAEVHERLKQVERKIESALPCAAGSPRPLPAACPSVPWDGVKDALAELRARESDLLNKSGVSDALREHVSSQFAAWLSSDAACRGSSRDFEVTCAKYEAELCKSQEEVDGLRKKCAVLETSSSEFEATCKEHADKVCLLQQTCDGLREQLSATAAGEARAADLEEEVRIMRDEEARKMEELQSRMDQFETAARAQVQRCSLELQEARQRAEDLEATVHSLRDELSESESQLDMERRATETREKTIVAERVALREQLQAARDMLSDANARLTARTEKKHQAAIDIAEEKLKWSQLLRTTEAALARCEAEKAACERELSSTKEKLRDLSKIQSTLEELRLAHSKSQSENEWLKSEKRAHQEQLRDANTELAKLRQEVRQMRFSASLR